MSVWIFTTRGYESSFANEAIRARARARGARVDVVVQEDISFACAPGEPPRLLLAGTPPRSLPARVLNRCAAMASHRALALPRYLERRGVVVVNSALATARARDKLQMTMTLAAAGLPIPKTAIVPVPLDREQLVARFEGAFPIVFKTLFGSQGRGVFLCRSPAQLAELSRALEADGAAPRSALAQEFVSASSGRHVRVTVIGGEALTPALLTARDGAWKSNAQGGAVMTAHPDPRAQELALRVAVALELDVAGVDLLFGPDGYLVCEANPAPQLKPAAWELHGARLGDRILELLMS